MKLCTECIHAVKASFFHPLMRCGHPRFASPVDGSPHNSCYFCRESAQHCSKDGTYFEPKEKKK